MGSPQKNISLALIEQTSDVDVSQRSTRYSDEESRIQFWIDPNDPIIDYFRAYPDVVELEKVNLISPTIDNFRKSGVQVIIPLVSQGELFGLISVGDELGMQDLNQDDQDLRGNLESKAETLLKMAQLARQESFEIREVDRLKHELRIARIIQESHLPQGNPNLPGWEAMTYSRPASAVGGDFYDFIHLSDGRLGLIIGDVTDKGLPAALVMAATITTLRHEIHRHPTPGQVLHWTNNLLYEDIPPNMFVTCLCIVMDPQSGNLSYANAGHILPICKRREGIEELHAAGMPLGLFPDMEYDEGITIIEPGDELLLYSDGLIEAHNQFREMFGFKRVRELIGEYRSGEGLVEFLLSKLDDFTGDEWEQEDDITFLVIGRDQQGKDGAATSMNQLSKDTDMKNLGEFLLPSEAGMERIASERVLELLREIPLEKTKQDRLKTAVSEATMNAIEHGNHFDREKPVIIRVAASETIVSVYITDQGGDQIISESKIPDIEAKLAGRESPRGWGMFIIRNMVDHFEIISGDNHHTIILTMFLGGDVDAR